MRFGVPPLAEINAGAGRTGFSCISTFSGIGGSSLGYRMAGIKPVAALEFVQEAADAYAANFPGTPVLVRNVRETSGAELLAAAGIAKGELDVLDGSPPCKSFTLAALREKAWGQEKHYCVCPDTKVLFADLTWHRAGDVVEGDDVIGFDEEATDRGRRKFKHATIEGTRRLTRPCVRVVTDDGTDVVCSVEHRWLVLSGRNRRWKQAGQITAGDTLFSVGKPWETADTREAGYLAGIFDGEGHISISKKKGQGAGILGFAQLPGLVLDTATAILDKLGAEYGIYDNKFCGVKHVNINGGAFGRARLIGMIRPPRMLAKAETLWNGVTTSVARKARVVSVEQLGDREVVAIQTSERTFVANGLLSHNSEGQSQRTDDLFLEYVRLIDEIRPKVFVAENVSGLVAGKALGYFSEFFEGMQAIGYVVEARLIDASLLGVPQRRKRLIFQGVRRDLAERFDVRPSYPRPILRPGQEVTIAEAFEGLPWPSPDDDPKTCHWLKPGSKTRRAWDLTDMRVGSGMLKYTYEKHFGKSARYSWFKLPPNRPSVTITATVPCILHWAEPRSYTIPEIKRLQSFPDDFVVPGTYEQAYERVGRAVPPRLMAAVAERIRDDILTPIRETTHV